MTSLPPGVDLSTIPLGPPPPGVTSNFVNPESIANTVLWIEVLLLVLTALVVIIRLLSNHHAPRGLGWDDCSCVIATLLLLVYVVVDLENRGFARHYYDIPIISITPSVIKKVYVQSVTQAPMVFFAKSTLFMLYYRLFKTQKLIRYAIFFGITFSFIFYCCYMIISAVVCAPEVGHPWDLSVIAKCSRFIILGLLFGIMNLALDLFLLVLPIPVILALQVSVNEKIGIFAIFIVGSFALIASIIALVYRNNVLQDKDSGWDTHIYFLCTMIEAGVTIMCSSTAALVAFWKSHMATNVTLLHSRLCSRCNGLATRLKLVSRSSADNQISPPESNQSKSYRSLYKLNYVELDERLQESAGFSGNIVRTEIGGGSPPTSDVEKGVIRKSMKVEQSFH